MCTLARVFHHPLFCLHGDLFYLKICTLKLWNILKKYFFFFNKILFISLCCPFLGFKIVRYENSWIILSHLLIFSILLSIPFLFIVPWENTLNARLEFICQLFLALIFLISKSSFSVLTIYFTYYPALISECKYIYPEPVVLVGSQILVSLSFVWDYEATPRPISFSPALGNTAWLQAFSGKMLRRQEPHHSV